jgi:thiol:disulfide interchange protein DsbD
MLIRILLLLSLSFTILASPNESSEDNPKLPVKFNATTINVDGQNYLSLNYSNHKKWHTYWKNPGDAGLPLKYFFKIDSKEVKLEELEWPIPKKYIEKGDMLAFGYEGRYSLFFKLPKKYLNSNISIKSHWLVCKHICIPGEQKLEAKLQDGEIKSLKTPTFEIGKDEVLSQFKMLPEEIEFPNNLDLVLAKYPGTEENKLSLYYNLSIRSALNFDRSRNLLTPFPVEPFTWIREKVFKDKKDNLYAKYLIEWDGEYVEPEIPLPANGKFKTPYTLKFLFANPETGQVNIIKKVFKEYSLDSGERFEKFTELLTPLVFKGSLKKDSSKDDSLPLAKKEKGLISFLILAFIGGLILNFMPCVLPVISIKLFSLVKQKGKSNAQILKHNLSYTLGILFTFSLLTLAIILFKQAGEQVGWGFQLQSPIFVMLMIFVLFIFSLNMFGLFEFKTPGGSNLGNVELKQGFSGDFFSGVLATILSTPCSAPFLGTALTFAFTSSNAMIFLIFMFVGLGLAFPFIMTGLFPSTISFLPKPGLWMEKLKKFLGLTLILTAVWLMDVFSALQDSDALFKLNLALVLCFFAFYLTKHITKSKVIIAIFHILYLALAVNIITTPVEVSSNTKESTKSHNGLKWEKWSEEKMNDYKSNGTKVFIDFTAKWCFTCKVNERLVIQTDEFKALVKEKNIKLLLGDWTKRDPVIGKWLKENGHVGVPAYFSINSKGELIKLGETISIEEIKKSLN